jgi:hypothetical protein
MIVYLAGPYRAPTKDGIQDNIDRAAVKAQWLWSLGYYVICPHLNSPHFTGPDSLFLDGYIEIMKRCDAVYVLADSESSHGTQAEIATAISIGLPVYIEGENEPQEDA